MPIVSKRAMANASSFFGGFLAMSRFRRSKKVSGSIEFTTSAGDFVWLLGFCLPCAVGVGGALPS